MCSGQQKSTVVPTTYRTQSVLWSKPGKIVIIADVQSSKMLPAKFRFFLAFSPPTSEAAFLWINCHFVIMDVDKVLLARNIVDSS